MAPTPEALSFALGILLLAGCASTGPAAPVGEPYPATLVAVTPEGRPGDSQTFEVAIDRNATWLVFSSLSSDLVHVEDPPQCPPNETRFHFDCEDLFVKHRPTGQIFLLLEGRPMPDAGADDPSVSPDGRWVVFSSDSTNLVEGDTNGLKDTFLYDRQGRGLQRVNLDWTGDQIMAEPTPDNPAGGFCRWLCGSPSVSGDGRFVVFTTWQPGVAPEDANAFIDVYVRDTVEGRTVLASKTGEGVIGDGPSHILADGHDVSADGRYVVFESAALSFSGPPERCDQTRYLPTAVDPNPCHQVYRKDLRTGELMLVSARPDGKPASGKSTVPSIDDSGRYVEFSSNAADLHPDATGVSQSYWKDLDTGELRLVSRDQNGNPANHAADGLISGDGRHVAITSSATNLALEDSNGEPTPDETIPGGSDGQGLDVFLWSADADGLVLFSRGVDGRQFPTYAVAMAISGDGRWIAYRTTDPVTRDDVNENYDALLVDVDAAKAWTARNLS